jgi:2-amino-4-hydroxy-6-hydroxymethyldihydropteridine diphosphokinase
VAERVFIGVGSNVGDRQKNCLDGIRGVVGDERAGTWALSSFYRTSPVSPVSQPDFINAVLMLEWSGSPAELLSLLLKIERGMGRQRTIALGPRNIDLDILLFGDLVLETADLVIPHPRLHERKFVLIPMLELDPDLRHPRLSRPLVELLEAIGTEQRVELMDSACHPVTAKNLASALQKC